MQNAIILTGSIVGLILGGWFALFLFHQSGELGGGVTAFMGAIPGMFVGGWIALRLCDRKSS
jgi:hypothetical protein